MVKDLSELETIVAIVAGSLPVIFALYKGFVIMLKLAKRKYILAKDFVTDLSDCVKLVNTELKPNHGSSIKDAISRIDNKITIIDLKNRAYLSHIEIPIIELDNSGNLQWINRAGYRLFDKDLSELINFGWLGSIPAEFRDDVESELLDSIRHKRSCTIKFKLTQKDTDIEVILEMSPIITNGQLNGYFGIIRALSGEHIFCPLVQIK